MTIRTKWKNFKWIIKLTSHHLKKSFYHRILIKFTRHTSIFKDRTVGKKCFRANYFLYFFIFNYFEFSFLSNILTVNHTIKENNKLLRIVLSVCCFDLRGTQMLAIDRRYILQYSGNFY